MKNIIVFLMLLCMPVFASKFKESDVRSIGDEISDPSLLNLARRTDTTIEQIVNRAIFTLRDQGFDSDADEFEIEFEGYRGFVVQHYASHHIGDFKPLIAWLENFYNTLETKLGVQTCKALHLSDLKSINMGIPVCFNPCNFDLNGQVNVDREVQFREHLAMDDGGNADPEHSLYGLGSVVVYWGIMIPCSTSTTGLASLLCGIAATAGEYFAGHVVLPPVSDKIYTSVCHQ